MANSDRRSGIDRRSHERLNVSIDMEWEGPGGRRNGTVSDLSVTGCFVLSSGNVQSGDTVNIYLPLGDGMKVQILGEVRNQAVEIGFAVRFIDPSDAQRSVIADLMSRFGESG
ncbi:MAG: PilZ domain-containing protein [Acidobacteria bacterium]|nr:PilZ domain-containing protein [Acidobacteriota bacterium]